jgi:integrase
MRVWKIKNGKKIIVYQLIGEVRVTKGNFKLSEKRLAKQLVKELEKKELDKTVVRQTFKNGFQLFVEKIDNDIKKGIIKKHSGLPYKSHVKYHIEPYIKPQEAVYLDEYKYSDFASNYIERLSQSQIPGKKTTISATTYKKVIMTFRLCIKFWNIQNFYTNQLNRILTYRTKVPASLKKQIKEEFYTTEGDVKILIKTEKRLDYKILKTLALVTGARTNEVLAACFEDIKDGIWSIRHTLDNDNVFEPYSAKTIKGFREIKLPSTIINIIETWKKINLNPKKEEGFTRIFNLEKSNVNKHITRHAKNNNIKWKGGLSPFRKLSSSLVFDKGNLSEKEFRTRFGWEDLKTFRKHYQRQTRKNLPDIDNAFTELNTIASDIIEVANDNQITAKKES